MVLIGIDPAVAKRTAVAVVIQDSVHLLMVNTFEPIDLVSQLTKLNIPELKIITNYNKASSRSIPQLTPAVAQRYGGTTSIRYSKKQLLNNVKFKF